MQILPLYWRLDTVELWDSIPVNLEGQKGTRQGPLACEICGFVVELGVQRDVRAEMQGPTVYCMSLR